MITIFSLHKASVSLLQKKKTRQIKSGICVTVCCAACTQVVIHCYYRLCLAVNAFSVGRSSGVCTKSSPEFS